VGLLNSLKNLFSSSGPKDNRKRIDLSKRFDIRGRHGQGSMSKVFQAYDRNIGRIICLKVLDKAKTIRFEDRFRLMGLKKPTEGEICMSLKHPNMVQTYEHALTSEGEPFLVMEWIEGLGLNYLIETRNAQLNGNRINFICQLCDAVEYIHQSKYLHRDLCPRNVMIDKEGLVKLIDFGLTVPYSPEYCQPGNRTGTADYLAPELIKRNRTDLRIDVFALGVTAYEVFTYQLPWERALSSEETLKKHLNSPPRNPKDLNPDLDDDLVEVLLKCIERDRDQRFSSARAFKEALKRLDRQDY
jgi:eukaryotic-like serine/threonine-protein kinase